MWPQPERGLVTQLERDLVTQPERGLVTQPEQISAARNELHASVSETGEPKTIPVRTELVEVPEHPEPV